MFKRVVVGHAGDQAGRDAITLGTKLAAADGSITIVYPYHPLLARIPAQTIETRIREETQELISESGVTNPIDCHWTSSPWPIHGLHQMASYENADLIVFGTAREALADHLHASLIERMVHGAPCAVAVAPAGYAEHNSKDIRRIGVGYADSEEGRMALRLGRDLTESLTAELELIAGSGLGANFTTYALSWALLPELEDELYADAMAKLEQLASELAASVSVSAYVRRGEPCEILTARSEYLDLLVLGSRAYGPLRHALLGSVSAPVVRGSHCPVLVVPRDTNEQPQDTLTDTGTDATIDA